MTGVDILRTLCISAGGLLSGFIVVVAYQYGRVWAKAPRDRGLLPFHVWVISTSYVLFLAGATAELVELVNAQAGVTWRLFVYGPAILLGFIAMWAIHGRRRDKKLKVHV